MSSHDEYIMNLKQEIQALKSENERLDDFCQSCLTKIGSMELLLREIYNKMGICEEIRDRINEFTKED